ncbi:MAG: NAD(P)H-hydrate dehydratase [Melioribacteraceae bacterium]|nr:NAD(P)H-hydrate dehydratase [Melioribacteraceae bacterium]MCF8264374.1 NAD(P)H-hydrate dehydratase [Melioribacteraceae bacterium]
MIPLFTAEQVRRADSYAIEKLNIPGIVLMENAAISIFESLSENIENFENVISAGILCGKGNNGGDGFALARHLVNFGIQVKIILFGSPQELKGDALINYKIAANLSAKTGLCSIVEFSTIGDLDSLRDSEIIIDAILGTGSKGQLREPFPEVINLINDMDVFRAAIDVPTGLETDTGFGVSVFNADLTITLAQLKRGLFVSEGYKNSGRVDLGSIGIGNEFFDELGVEDYFIEKEDIKDFLPVKKLDIHKYSAGKVLSIAGSTDYPGAGILTAKAASMSGAGASILAVPNSKMELMQRKVISEIIISYEDNANGFLIRNSISDLEKKIEWSDCLAIGPGLGREAETKFALSQLYQNYLNKNIIIDADGFAPLTDNQFRNYDLSNFILTPHLGEFSKLIAVDIDTIKRNILKFGKEFARSTGCVLVLKGAPTITFDSDGIAYINSVGNPGMAKFGSGDVLTGIIASFVAQGSNKIENIIAAVYVHSLGADLLAEQNTTYGVTAEGLIKYIPRAIKEINNNV